MNLKNALARERCIQCAITSRRAFHHRTPGDGHLPIQFGVMVQSIGLALKLIGKINSFDSMELRDDRSTASPLDQGSRRQSARMVDINELARNVPSVPAMRQS
jgi:hypothetical protein